MILAKDLGASDVNYHTSANYDSLYWVRTPHRIMNSGCPAQCCNYLGH